MADGSKPSRRSGNPSQESAASSTSADKVDEVIPGDVDPDPEDSADSLVEAETSAGEPHGSVEDEAGPVDAGEQADESSAGARQAQPARPRPVKRNLTVAPVKKAAPTPKRDQATTRAKKRTTPVLFAKQSVGELKKVVWPTSATLRQYFVVVLVFVLFIMFFVASLDAVFGWLLLKWLG